VVAGRLEGAVLDLTVSPDWAAYTCYGIVAVLGVFVAVVEVKKRLGTMQGYWFLPGTWILFGAYALVPLILYWLLDRTGAVNDTSVFAAVLIGFGYRGIITGGSQTIRAPGEVSAFWSPFVAYADKVAKEALDRGALNQRRLAEKIIGEIMKERSRYDALQALALDRTSDVAAVNAALASIDQLAGAGPGERLEKKTRYLYGVLLSVPDIQYLLRSKNVVDSRFYWLHLKGIAHLLPIGVVAVAVAIAVTTLVVWSYPDFREIATTYHVWRLGKTNSSKIDQYRSRRALVVIMADSAPLRQRATAELIYLIQRPGLPMERVDLILQTLLETHPGAPKNDLSTQLVQALRGPSLDARTRVHDSLVFLSTSCQATMDPALRAWKPTERDSSTALEEKIVAWNAYWKAC